MLRPDSPFQKFLVDRQRWYSPALDRLYRVRPVPPLGPKARCSRCCQAAVWIYGGGGASGRPWLWCDDHVPRGCDCVTDSATGLPLTDQLGRELPCIEWIYEEDGFARAGADVRWRRLELWKPREPRRVP